MRILFWRTKIEVETKEILLAQYRVIKEWLTVNRIKHNDRFGNPGDGWAYVASVQIKDSMEKGHKHTFQFYKTKDAIFFKMTWGGIDV